MGTEGFCGRRCEYSNQFEEKPSTSRLETAAEGLGTAIANISGRRNYTSEEWHMLAMASRIMQPIRRGLVELHKRLHDAEYEEYISGFEATDEDAQSIG